MATGAYDAANSSVLSNGRQITGVFHLDGR